MSLFWLVKMLKITWQQLERTSIHEPSKNIKVKEVTNGHLGQTFSLTGLHFEQCKLLEVTKQSWNKSANYNKYLILVSSNSLIIATVSSSSGSIAVKLIWLTIIIIIKGINNNYLLFIWCLGNNKCEYHSPQRWLLRRGYEQWKILKPSSLKVVVLAYKSRFQPWGFHPENFGVLLKWSLSGGSCLRQKVTHGGWTVYYQWRIQTLR